MRKPPVHSIYHSGSRTIRLSLRSVNALLGLTGAERLTAFSQITPAQRHRLEARFRRYCRQSGSTNIAFLAGEVDQLPNKRVLRQIVGGEGK